MLKLFGVIKETDVFIGCLLAFCCGLRISEVCNLKKFDVDFENSKIKIVKGKGNNDRSHS